MKKEKLGQRKCDDIKGKIANWKDRGTLNMDRNVTTETRKIMIRIWKRESERRKSERKKHER